jgi:Co/Zn/Cd efflux system component
VIALLIGYESAVRLLNPVSISFEQAIAIAIIGLAVNLASVWLLREEHSLVSCIRIF